MINEVEAKNPDAKSPWEKDLLYGWNIKTEVRESLIPGAGRGRFVMEDVKKGQVIRKPFKIVPASENLV